MVSFHLIKSPIQSSHLFQTAQHQDLRFHRKTLLAHFSKQNEYANLTEEDLMEGGPLFSQVLFGNSHQGSAVNLLTGNADVAAFCDTCVENYVEIAEGDENTVGSVYRVKEGAAEPFNTVPGKEFVINECYTCIK